MDGFSVSRAATFGFRLFQRDPLTFLGCTLVSAAMGLAFFVLVGPSYAAMVQASLNEDPTAVSEAALSMADGVGPFFLISMLGGMMVMGAIYRSLVFDGSRGWFLGLKLGPDELRLLWVVIAVTVLVAIPYVLGAGAIVAGAAFFGQSLVGGLVIFAGFLTFFGLMIWLGVRFTPAAAMTVGDKRISIFRAFALSKGRAWSIFGAYAILYLIVVVLYLLVAGIIVAIAAAIGSGFGNLQDFTEMGAMSLGPVSIIGALVYGALYTWLYGAFFGVSAYSYLALRPQPESDAAVFA